MTEYGAAAAGATVGAASGKAVSDGISSIFGKTKEQTVKAAGEDADKEKDSKDKGKEKAKEKAKDKAPSVAKRAPIAPSVAGSAAARKVAGNSGAPDLGGGAGGGSRSSAAASGFSRSADPSMPPPPPPLARAPARKAATERVALDIVMNRPPEVPFAPFTLADALPATPIPPPATMTAESFKQIVAGMKRSDVLRLGDPSSRVAMFEDGHMLETFSYRASGERFGRLQLQDGAVVKIDTN